MAADNLESVLNLRAKRKFTLYYLLSMNRRISVRGIALHDGKLLCVKNKVGKNSQEPIIKFWCLPGGGLEEGEALLDGITREMVEETGVKPRIGNLLYIQQFVFNDKEYLEFFFHITNGSDYTSIDLANTTHGLKEIEEIGFIDPSKVPILPKFLGTEPLEEHAAKNEPAKVISY